MARTVIDEFVVEYFFQGDYSGLDRLQSRVGNARKSLLGVAGGMSAIGAAATAALGLSAVAFSSIDTDWDQFSAKTGIAVDDLKRKYGEAAEGLAVMTGRPFGEVIDGFQKAVSAGLDGAEAIDAVTQASKVSAVGLGNLSESVSAATTMWSALGTEVKRSQDLIAFASQKGEGEAADYANAVKKIVGQVFALELSEEDMIAGLVEVSKIAPNVRQGATQFEGFLRTLAKPAAQAQKALKDSLGITFDDLRKTAETQGLPAVMEILSGVIGEPSDKAEYEKILKAQGEEAAERYLVSSGVNIELLGEIFSEVEAMKFFLTVTPEGMKTVKEEARDVTGVIDTAFETRLDSIGLNFNRIVQSIKLLGASIGVILEPAIISISESLIGMLEKFRSMPEPMRRTAAYGLVLAAALLPIGAALAAAIVLLPAFYAGLGLLSVPIAIVAIKLGLILLVLAAIAAAIILLVTHWDEVGRAIGNFGRAFGDMIWRIGWKWKQMINGVKRAWNDFKLWWNDIVEGLGLPDWMNEVLKFSKVEPTKPDRALLDLVSNYAQKNLALSERGPNEEAARQLADRVKDYSQWLAEEGGREVDPQVLYDIMDSFTRRADLPEGGKADTDTRRVMGLLALRTKPEEIKRAEREESISRSFWTPKRRGPRRGTAGEHRWPSALEAPGLTEPPSLSAALAELLKRDIAGFAEPLPVGPTNAQIQQVTDRTTNNAMRTQNFEINVAVDAGNADAKEVSEIVPAALADTVQLLLHRHDSPIER